MRVCKLSRTGDLKPCVQAATHILSSGGVIIYPTDTLYGLGADALSDTAVDAVYALKERDGRKPMHAVVADLAMAERYGVVNPLARKLAKRFLPGALTLVLEKREGEERGIMRGMGTIGIRIPDDRFCLALARAFGKPFTATSANISGEDAELDITGIQAQLGAHAERVGLVVDAGPLTARMPSSVVDVSSGVPNVLREGAISERQIMEAASS